MWLYFLWVLTIRSERMHSHIRICMAHVARLSYSSTRSLRRMEKSVRDNMGRERVHERKVGMSRLTEG